MECLADVPLHAAYLVGDAASRPVGDDSLGPGTANLNGFTAVVLHLVVTAADGLASPEIARCLAQEGADPVVVGRRLPVALASLQSWSRIGFHYEVAQSASDQWQTQNLKAVRVYTAPQSPASLRLYGGFQHADCPKCFRGIIEPDQVAIPHARTLVHTLTGPITRSPIFAQLRARAASAERMQAIGSPAHAMVRGGQPRCCTYRC